jgi:ring-1,2-phenylacetyl-CoA epoxidase subunit PaaC
MSRAVAADATLPSDAVAELLLSLADDEFVIGFWDSEWTGIAPMLEEDVATSSISQDEIGHAKALYELRAELTGEDPDRAAFGREPDEYRHAALLNHPRTDWAFTVARRYLYETADATRLEALALSTYEPLARLAAKMRREERYHLMHLGAWMDRLAHGGPDTRRRLAEALAALWADAQTVFTPLEDEPALVEAGILPEPMAALRRRWADGVGDTLRRLDLPVPDPAPEPAADGRRRRTEDFRWLHHEFTMVARSDPDATW